MSLVSAAPAAVRARRAAVLAMVGAVVVGAGIWAASTSPRRGILLAFLGLSLIHVALRRRQDLLLLDRLGPRHLSEIAESVPVLRQHGSVDGMAEWSDLAGREFGLVPTDDGWRVLSRDDIAEVVLAAPGRRFSGDWGQHLRTAPLLEPDVRVDRLRRIPGGSEYWLVRNGLLPPRALTVGVIHRAVRPIGQTSASPSSGRPRVGALPPSPDRPRPRKPRADLRSTPS